MTEYHPPLLLLGSSGLGAGSSRSCRAVSAHQRGVVLIIALIVLVAMSLAAVALTRSVDIASIAAGNLSFKKGALSATDIGVADGVAKFKGPGGALSVPGSTDNPTGAVKAANAYYETIQPSDVRGVPTLLIDANVGIFDANHIQVKFCIDKDSVKRAAADCKSDDIATVRYLIERQCTRTGAVDPAFCSLATPPGAQGGTVGLTQTGAEAVALFRVTVRVDGPSNTTSFSQVMLRP